MTRSDVPTSRVELAPTILVVACPPPLVRACREAAIQGQALVVESDVASAPTLAAQTRPLAMVMLDDVYAFDPPFFMALAADVRSRLVLLAHEHVARAELESLILTAIGEAEQARESWRRDSY
jgi:hypothetical protein